MKYIIVIFILLQSTMVSAASYGGDEFGVVVTYQRELIPEGSGQTFTFTRSDTAQSAHMLLSIDAVGFGSEYLFVSEEFIQFDVGESERSIEVNISDNEILDEVVKSVHFNTLIDGYELLSWNVDVDDRNAFERGLFSASLNSNIYKFGADVVLDVRRENYSDIAVDLLALINYREYGEDYMWAIVPFSMVANEIETTVDLTGYLSSDKTFSVELLADLPIIVNKDTGYFDVIEQKSSLATFIQPEDFQYEISGLGSFPVTLVRTGNLSYEVAVSLNTTDPDIKVIDKEVVFLQNQSQRIILFENKSFIDREFTITIDSSVAYTEDVSIKVSMKKELDPRTVSLSAPDNNIVHGTKSISVTASLAAPLSFDLPIELVGFDGTAISGEHYSIDEFSGVIAAGQQSITFDVSIFPEAINSATSFQLGLISEFFTAEFTDLITISLLEEPEIEPSYVSIVESKLSFYESEGFGTVRLERSGNMETSFDIAVSYHNGTALGSVDYLPIIKVLTFKPFQSHANFEFTLIDNDFADGDKEFTVQISAEAEFVGLKGEEATVTIIDDEYHLANFISFGSDGVTAFVGDEYSQHWVVKEATTARKLTILREGDTSQTLELTLTSSDLTASSGRDYKAINERVLFASGETKKEITVMFVSGSVASLTESFFINVKSNNANVITTGNLLLVTIERDSLFGDTGNGDNSGDSASGGSTGWVFITLIGLLFIVRWKYLIE